MFFGGVFGIVLLLACTGLTWDAAAKKGRFGLPWALGCLIWVTALTFLSTRVLGIYDDFDLNSSVLLAWTLVIITPVAALVLFLRMMHYLPVVVPGFAVGARLAVARVAGSGAPAFEG